MDIVLSYEQGLRWSEDKDRQQEAERHSRYLALLSSSNPHNIIAYIK